MQVRKIIRLLEKIAKEHGDRCHVCIDVDRYERWHGAWSYDRVISLEIDHCININPDNDCPYENGSESKVVVLNKR